VDWKKRYRILFDRRVASRTRKAKAFAGRPNDFDIAIKEQDCPRLLSLQSELLKLGLKTKNHTAIRRDKRKYGELFIFGPKF